MLKKREIIFILREINASSLLIDTLDFMKANIPFSGNAGKMNPPYFLDKISVKIGVLQR
jgi:hypothetical protein